MYLLKSKNYCNTNFAQKAPAIVSYAEKKLSFENRYVHILVKFIYSEKATKI
jgi:hypothetical protein